MYGGIITGGSASASGGNIYSCGTMNLMGGTITGGKTAKWGGNIYASGAAVNLGGCTVENGTAAESGQNFWLDANSKLNVTSAFAGLTTVGLNTAHLPASVEGGWLLDTHNSCEGPFTGKLYVENTGELVRLQGRENDTKLYTVAEQAPFSGTGDAVATCQHCEKNVVWRPLTAEVWTAWNKNYDPSAGTHYYLAEETVTGSGTLSIASGETLCLHLNGNTFTGKSTRPFRVYGAMNLMDHAANEGLLYGMAGNGSTGCVIRVESGCSFNMYGGNLEMRSGTYTRGGNGGILYLDKNTVFNMYGGSITGGVGENGGNLYVGTGATATLLGGTISGGEALKIDSTDGYGGNIYVSGNLVLGNCTIIEGTAAQRGSDLYFGADAKLTVKKEFAGSVKLGMNSAHLPEPLLGGALTDTQDTCEGPFPGKLYLENSDLLPAVFGKDGDTKLYVADTALVKKDGTTAWYGSAAETMEAYDDTVSYLFTGAAALVVDGGTYTVDLRGADLAVSGSGTVTFFDSANKDGKTYGTATVTDVTVANSPKTEVDGTAYYMIKEDSAYSFHCLEAKLTNVNIRPANTGIYYDGVWTCDEKLADRVESYGVAVSLTAIPTETFESNNSCLFTAYGKDTLVSGTTKTGVIIQGIMLEKNEPYRNDKNAKMPIHARAYVKLVDGTVIVSEYAASESLHSAMTRLDDLIGQDATVAQKYLADARAFYETWKYDGMGDWELENIPAPPAGEDGVLNLLMVGNSFCYYYVEELYDLLMADLPEGVTEVNIYNLYYSGCRLDQHLSWWQNGTAKYEFYKTDANGRNLLGEKGAWTLEQALIMENWDYISLQGMPKNGSYSRWEETELHLKVAELAEPLLDRFHELHPDAQLLWHRTWALEEGRVTDSTYYTKAVCESYDIGMQAVCDYMCNEWDKTQPYDLIQVNSGAIWQMVREENAKLDESLLPFGGLTARLGYSTYGNNYGKYLEHIGVEGGYNGPVENSGDGQHDGDIGGGQLINAYAWYETLTGSDSRQSDYVPTYTRSGSSYTLSEELCALIRDCTHEVISNMPEAVQPAG